jgi:hypothetical protein
MIDDYYINNNDNKNNIKDNLGSKIAFSNVSKNSIYIKEENKFENDKNNEKLNIYEKDNNFSLVSPKKNFETYEQQTFNLNNNYLFKSKYSDRFLRSYTSNKYTFGNTLLELKENEFFFSSGKRNLSQIYNSNSRDDDFLFMNHNIKNNDINLNFNNINLNIDKNAKYLQYHDDENNIRNFNDCKLKDYYNNNNYYHNQPLYQNPLSSPFIIKNKIDLDRNRKLLNMYEIDKDIDNINFEKYKIVRNTNKNIQKNKNENIDKIYEKQNQNSDEKLYLHKKIERNINNNNCMVNRKDNYYINISKKKKNYSEVLNLNFPLIKRYENLKIKNIINFTKEKDIEKEKINEKEKNNNELGISKSKLIKIENNEYNENLQENKKNYNYLISNKDENIKSFSEVKKK